MGSIERRLDRLEARSSEHRETDEGYEKQHWLARARISRREAMPRSVWRARDLIRLFRRQEILSEMTTEELVGRILGWRPPMEGLTPSVAEREVALAIYNQEPGTENMVCPPAWRESFVAGDELRSRLETTTDEALLKALESGEHEAFEPLGITEELERRAIGPDVDEITEEERSFRVGEYAADILYGERGYRLAKLMARKAAESGSE